MLHMNPDLHPCPECEKLTDVSSNPHGGEEDFYCHVCNLAYNVVQPCAACGTRKYVYEDETTKFDYVCFNCNTRYDFWTEPRRVAYE
jgi:hypothetical protein